MSRDPYEPFWLAVSLCRADDSLSNSLREEVEGAFSTEAEASAAIKRLLKDHGTEGYVYRCVPVLEIRRSPRVRRLSAPSIPDEPIVSRTTTEGGE